MKVRTFNLLTRKMRSKHEMRKRWRLFGVLTEARYFFKLDNHCKLLL